MNRNQRKILKLLNIEIKKQDGIASLAFVYSKTRICEAHVETRNKLVEITTRLRVMFDNELYDLDV